MTHTTRTTATPAPRTVDPGHRHLGEITRGLTALLLLLALVVGIPIVLLVVAPALNWAPVTWHGVIAALTRPDDGHLFLAALTVTAWVAWFLFALSVILETAAVLRGLPTPRIPLLAAPQRGAASLVAAAAILLTTPTPAPTPTYSVLPSVTLAAQVHPTHPAQPSPVARDASNGEATLGATTAYTADSGVANSGSHTAKRDHPHSSVTVRRGDTLWGIAASHLGDGSRFQEIARLNYGRPQPDGRTLTDTHWVRPGWILLLPIPTAHTGPKSASWHTTPDGTRVVAGDEYVVRPGDNLWDVAATHLGDPNRFREIYLLNRGHRQPDGGHLHDPQIIKPGWVLRLPLRLPTRVSPTASPRPVVLHPSPSPTHPLPVEAHRQPPREPTRAPTPGEPRIESTSTPPPRLNDSTTLVAPDEANPGVGLGQLTLGLTALAATGVLAELARRRRRQQSRRLPGQRIPMPVGDAATAERTLRTAYVPVTLDTLTAAMNQMVATCRASDRDLPRVLAVLVSPTTLDLLVDDHEAPTAPFFAAADHGLTTTWRLDPTQLHDDGSWGTSCSAYPALVSIGTTDDAIVLLNLEAAGTLVIEGPPDAVGAVRRTLGVELATSPLSSGCTLILPAWLGDLAEVADPDRVCAVPTDAALRRATVRTVAVEAALTEQHVDDVHSARTRGAAPDTWTPEIHLIDEQQRVARPWSGIAAISSRAAADDSWTVTVTGGGAAKIQPLDLDITVAPLNDYDYAQLLELLRGADCALVDAPAPRSAANNDDIPEPVDLRDQVGAITPIRTVALRSRRPAVLAALPQPPRRPEADDVRDQTPDAICVKTGPRVLLLGRVDVVGAASDGAAPRRGRSVELLAYLALHPGATAREIDDALWPGRRVSDDMRNSLVTRTRNWLGADDDGQTYLPPVTNVKGYRLSSAVTCDWYDALTLARAGLAADSTGHLELGEALELVRGRPFLGVDPSAYAWAETDAQTMISSVVDIAHEVAARHGATGNYTEAQAAIARGLLADPANQQLHHDAISIAGQRGDINEVRRMADRFRAQLQAIDPDATLDPATAQLLEAVLGGSRATVTPPP